MSDPAALAGFIDKWRARWPEWQVARVFLPATHREVAAAWLSLLQELTDAAWGGSDPTPGLAKLAWWQEELRGWNRGARRHPLGLVLQRLPVPWPGLAGTLLELQRTRSTPGSAGDAFAGLATFSRAVAQCESVLFSDAPAAQAGDSAPIQFALLGARMLDDPESATPWDIDGEPTTGADALAQRRTAWIDALLSPGQPADTAVRRIQLALVQGRLRRLHDTAAAVEPLPPVQALWTAWRAARA